MRATSRPGGAEVSAREMSAETADARTRASASWGMLSSEGSLLPFLYLLIVDLDSPVRSERSTAQQPSSSMHLPNSSAKPMLSAPSSFPCSRETTVEMTFPLVGAEAFPARMAMR